ncbi:hypothetical protein PMIN01_08417 [Paraphaeosphaeria minitans]|uniref:Uncharacterized protein n=1 Tax=Paraphaeosphaeria minitans TaxID=565426 RepID=A0A9P6GH63_9PLEO|nr:hypothetical protein PMIN01_08417 [Paraphaeosphaeria minitans]
MRLASRHVSACCTRDVTQGSAWSWILQDCKSSPCHHVTKCLELQPYAYTHPSTIYKRQMNGQLIRCDYRVTVTPFCTLAACSTTHGSAFRQVAPSPIRLTRLPQQQPFQRRALSPPSHPTDTHTTTIERDSNAGIYGRAPLFIPTQQ